MTGFTKIARLDFFTMKPQVFSYFAVVPMILMFGVIGSPTSISCTTGAWFMALMASNIFPIQEKTISIVCTLRFPLDHHVGQVLDLLVAHAQQVVSRAAARQRRLPFPT